MHYLSIQYSGIQKTILRHDRLWSIAGMSQIMAWMNELAMPSIETGMSEILSKLNELLICEIAEVNGARVLVAGGGKFTARFNTENEAKTSKEEIKKLISTTFPMLEYQVSEIVKADSLDEATKQGIIAGLNEQKKCFRGYGITFNPHLKTCPECGEYPSLKLPVLTEKKEIKDFCSICLKAYQKSKITLDHVMKDYKDDDKKRQLTTLERIYRKYFKKVYENGTIPKIAHNFEDLFPGDKKKEKGKRMAVWFSDLNNMKQKVTIWFSQEDDKIPEIFSMIKDVNVDIVSDALIKTFGKTDEKYLPFRLIVAGGDDLRIVMDEQYILDFVLNLSKILNLKINKFENCNEDKNNYKYLKTQWLQEERNKYLEKIVKPISNEDSNSAMKPFSFGGAFAVTPIHAPFRKIHEACEDMMSKAKKETDRMGNSVNWSVLSVEETSGSAEMKFDKPLFIEDSDSKNNGKELSFRTYMKMRDFYYGIITGSHIQQIADKIIEFKSNSSEVEKWLKQAASAELEKSFEFVLVDKHFRHGLKEDGAFDCRRLSTLLELLSISKKG